MGHDSCTYIHIHVYTHTQTHTFMCVTGLDVWLDFMSHVSASQCSVQPIADRVAQHLEVISQIFQFCTRRTRILMGFIICYLVLIVNPMGRILVRWKSFRDNLEMLCHPICNWLYIYLQMSSVVKTRLVTWLWSQQTPPPPGGVFFFVGPLLQAPW